MSHVIEETRAATASRLSAALLRVIPNLPSLAGLFAFAVAALRGQSLLNDPDTFLHTAAGQWMLSHHVLPASDPFSHSLAGARWIVHEWLAELVLGATFALFGWHAIILLTALCFGLALALLTRFLIDRGETMTSLVVAIAAGTLIEPHLLARPHLLALPAMMAWCTTLIVAREKKAVPPFTMLWLMTLWANLHGSFIVGLGLAVFLGAEAALERGERWRAEFKGWLLFGTLALIAAGINPNGVETFLLPLRFMGMTVLQNSFVEWLSPNFHTPQPLELWLLGLLLAGYGWGLKLPPWRLLFLAMLVHLGLQATRHADLLAVLGPLLAWPALAPQIKARITIGNPSELARSFAALAGPASAPALVATAVMGVAIGIVSVAKPAQPPDGPATPVAALAAARSTGLSGNLLNGEGFGGYLIFNGVPVFIDGRVEMYGADFLARYLAAERGDETGLTAILARYRIQWTMFPPQTGAALVLARLPGWQRVYADGVAVIDRRIAQNK